MYGEAKDMQKISGRIVLGALITIVGLLMLLNNLEITDVGIGELIANGWPLIIVYFGLKSIRASFGSALAGGFLVLLGLILTAHNFNLVNIDLSWIWKIFWPVVVIMLGINFLTGPRSGGRGTWAFMGGIEKTDGPWSLENGDYWAFMGGMKLDLRQASIPAGETYLTMTAFMGGMEIIIPPDLAVKFEGIAFMGGLNLAGKGHGGIFSNLTAEHGDVRNSPRVLRIEGRCLMGGIDIKVR